MLALDLFNTKYEQDLREGAVDDLESRRIDTLNDRMQDLLARAKEPAYQANPRALAALKKQFQQVKDERDSYYKVRNETMEYDELGKAGLPDIADKKAKMARLNQPGKVGSDAVSPQQRINPNPNKGIVGHAADWLRGKGGPGQEGPTYESELSEQDEELAQQELGDGYGVYKELLNAWNEKKPYVIVPMPGGQNLSISRNQIFNVLYALKSMNDNTFKKTIANAFSNLDKFMVWSNSIKRYQLPKEKPQSPPGQMKLFKEAGQKKNSDKAVAPQNPEVDRYLTKVRRASPNATSDLEAIAKDELEKQARVNKNIDDLEQVNARQDAALKKAMTLDLQQGNEIDNVERQINQLSQQVQSIKTAKPVAGQSSRVEPQTATPAVEPTSTASKVKSDKPADQSTTVNIPQPIYIAEPEKLPQKDQEIYAQVKNLEAEIKQKIDAMATWNKVAQKDDESRNELEMLRKDMERTKRELNSKIKFLKKSGANVQQADPGQQNELPLGTAQSRNYISGLRNQLGQTVGNRIPSVIPAAPEDDIQNIISPEQFAQLGNLERQTTESATNVRAGMAQIYRRLAPKIERYRDSFLAGQLYDELENYAELHSAEGEFKRMMNGARNRAHMEYDTNPGGFHNWFWFLPFEDNMEEGIKSQLAGAALAGTLALGAGSANARVTGDEDPGVNRLTGKPNVTQAVQGDQVKPSAPTGFSKEYLQSVVDGTHSRPMITKEKAQALLNQLKEQGVAEGTDDIKKRMSKLEALALAANRAGDDAKCKMYQQKIQSLKQKLSQSMNEFDASGYDRYSIYMDDYDLEEKFSDLDDAIEAIEAYKRDDPKSRYADYNVRDLNGKVVWRNDAWQDVPKPGKIQFLPPKTETIDSRVSTNTEQQWMQSIKQQYPGVKFAQNKTTMQIFAMVPGKGKVGTFDPRQQVTEFEVADLVRPGEQTDTPPRRAYSIALQGSPGKDFRAEYAWKALNSVFPKEYPAGADTAEQKVAEVTKRGSAIVKTGIASEDIADTYVAKLSRFVPEQFWKIVGGELEEATGNSKFDAMMGKISKDPWTQLNSDPNWQYEIEELVDQQIEPWLLAMERSGMPITRDGETLNPGWRKRYEQISTQLAQKYLASKKFNPRDPDMIGKIRAAIDWHTNESRNVHGQLSAYADDLPMQRYADAFDADGMTANIRDAMAGLAPRDDDDDDGYAPRPRPTADPRRLDPGNIEEGMIKDIDVMRQDLDSMSDLQFLRAYGMNKDQFKYKYRNLLKPAPQQDVPVQESLQPGEYYVHTVYFKDGTKKRIRVTSDEFDVADYYTKRGQAVDRVDYDFQLHSDMTEGLKSTLAGAALAGAMALGGAGAAQAQSASSGPNLANPTTIIQQIQSGKIQNQNDLASALGNASNKQAVFKILQNKAGLPGHGADSVINALGKKSPGGAQQPATGAQPTVKSAGQSGSIIQRPTDNFEGRMKEEFSMPGTTIPLKSVIQGFTVFYNPKTRTISITRGGDSAEAAIEQIRIKQPTMLAFKSAVDRLINKIEDDQDLTEVEKEPTTRQELLNRLDKIQRMMTQDRNPANLQILRKELEMLKQRYQHLREDNDSEAVEIAIIKRILVSHIDLIMEFGLDKVTQAIEEVAYNVGDVDEIGTSDVSAYVNQVKQILGADA